MGFVKREVAENFVSLGEGEGDVRQVGGILTRFVENKHFDKPKTDYEFIDKNGELQVLSGSASLARQIHSEDLGKFFKATFEGWGKSANGKFKQIAVFIWEGELNPAMKAWPKLDQYYGKRPTTIALVGRVAPKPAATDDFDEMPEPIQQGQVEDDDLPF
jgi:hypothetical protein